MGCSALSSLRSLGFFEFSILAFSIFDFDISIFGCESGHLGYFPIHFHAPDTSRCVFLLDFNINCNNFRNLEKCDFYFSVFEFVLTLLLTISKIESVKLKYVIIAKCL